MSQGTLYVGEYARCFLVKGLVEFYNLDVTVAAKDAAYEKNFPLAKYPAFLGPKGYKLTEAIAVVLYCKYFVLCHVFGGGFCSQGLVLLQ